MNIGAKLYATLNNSFRLVSPKLRWLQVLPLPLCLSSNITFEFSKNKNIELIIKALFNLVHGSPFEKTLSQKNYI